MRPSDISLGQTGLHLHEVGIRIKTWRLRPHITQQQPLENGRRASNLLTYMAIARALDVDVGDLVTQRRR